VAAVIGAGLLLLCGPGMASCSSGAQGAPPVPMPRHPQWQSGAPLGSWQNAGFDVFNNEWNRAQAGPQRIWANSFHSWGVESRQPASSSVKTYPCVQLNYRKPPALASFTRLTSTFAESMPVASASYEAEAAYDIWLNSYKVEVMIWVANHGRTPAGSILTHLRIGDREFTVWHDGPNMFSFVLGGQPETSGPINILRFFGWLVSHRFLSRSDTMTQVNFGWEIASTGGATLDFSMQRYSLLSSYR
jgi:Glycosyl hydrolase family 12